MDQLPDAVGFLASLIEVGTLLVVIILFLRARREYRRYVEARKTESGETPWVLAIGIGGGITGQVKAYLESANLADIPVENYAREGHLPTKEFYDVLRDMLKIKNKLSQYGATEVHLFYRGPVTLAMGIGSIFDNWVPVKIYEHDQGTYRLDFVLEKGSVLGLLGTGRGSTIEDVIGG